MGKVNSDTLNRILLAGKEEFLAKGFRGASLRSIAKHAQVTTGAIYGYYADKQALFDALVSEPANTLRVRFITAQDDFDALPAKRQAADMYAISSKALQELFDYVYENFDAFKLILCHSAGTSYEGFVDSLVEIEIKNTVRFMDRMRAAGYPVRKVSQNLNHILANAYFSAIFETVTHDMPKTEADAYVASLAEFFYAGWKKMFRL